MRSLAHNACMEIVRKLPSALRARVAWYALSCPHRVPAARNRCYCRLCGEPCYHLCMHLTHLHPEDLGRGGVPALDPPRPGNWVCPACFRSRCRHQSTRMRVACGRCILAGLCCCC